jgi:hypothetical protein
MGRCDKQNPFKEYVSVPMYDLLDYDSGDYKWNSESFEEYCARCRCKQTRENWLMWKIFHCGVDPREAEKAVDQVELAGA